MLPVVTETLQFLAKYTVVLPTLLAIALWVLHRITAHSLFLYAQRTSAPDQAVRSYRFAVQNNEDVPLQDQAIRITILDADGRFLEGPDVYKGLTSCTAGVDETGKSWTMTFAELPPYETWTIDCVMNAFARNIRLDLPRSTVSLHGNELCLTADQQSLLVGRTSTEWWWCLLSMGLGAIAYAVVVWQPLGRFEREDGVFVGIMISFALLVYCCTRFLSPRVAPPVTQGYWEPTRTTFSQKQLNGGGL